MLHGMGLRRTENNAVWYFGLVLFSGRCLASPYYYSIVSFGGHSATISVNACKLDALTVWTFSSTIERVEFNN